MTPDKPAILIVDDEKEYLDDFKSFFGKKFNLFTASSGEEALNLLSKNSVAVVVSDQRMPEMTGSQFLGEVAREYPHTVRILLTGYSDLDAVIEAVNKGEIYRYLTKDQPLKEIEFAIQEGLEKYKNLHGIKKEI